MGSIDSKVPLETYVLRLKEMGYQGMMITDHDSYKGCHIWDEMKTLPAYEDFTVIKGIEYDTKDAGHFLVIMPEDALLHVLEIRGMKLKTLIKIVHHYGGILGPAHPYGGRSSSAMLFKQLVKNPSLIHEFDFIETFNGCESPLSNLLAQKLAQKYGKVGLGGSDTHQEKYLGLGYTEVDAVIHSNEDLISAVKNHRIVAATGREREATTRSKHKEAAYSVWSFHIYNKGLGKLFSPYRGLQIYQLNL